MIKNELKDKCGLHKEYDYNEYGDKYLKAEYFHNNGIKEGIYKEYDEKMHKEKNFKLECNYINGKRNGMCVEYLHHNKHKIVSYYIDDQNIFILMENKMVYQMNILQMVIFQ
jgi:antitoxin component YwqK of YwqJK toxin-antitoxin module